MEPIVQVRDVSKVYKLGKERVVALSNVNLNFFRNEIVCILGPSGSGKSTLLHLLAGFEKPSSGVVLLDNINVNHCSANTLTSLWQHKMGFVFQNFNLMQYLTALENVALPLTFQGVSESDRINQAKAMLEMVGLSSRLHHLPTQMSGGQQQRVSIARAFITNPSVIFADEPTGNLDSQTSRTVLNLMIKLSREREQALLIVTHNQEIAEYTDRIVQIADGRVLKDERTRIQ